MSKELDELIERARKHPMTDKEIDEQRRNWEKAEEELAELEQATTIIGSRTLH